MAGEGSFPVRLLACIGTLHRGDYKYTAGQQQIQNRADMRKKKKQQQTGVAAQGCFSAL